MQSLLYPAMLGTFFVLFITKFLDSTEGLLSLYKIDFLYSIFLIFYFCISFLVNESIGYLKIYNSVSFVCDIVEIFLMFLCFSALKIDRDLTYSPDVKQFFFFAMLIPIEQLCWNWSMRENRKIYYYLDILGFVILLAGFLYGYQYNLFNYMIFVIISLILVYYFRVLLRDGEYN